MFERRSTFLVQIRHGLALESFAGIYFSFSEALGAIDTCKEQKGLQVIGVKIHAFMGGVIPSTEAMEEGFLVFSCDRNGKTFVSERYKAQYSAHENKKRQSVLSEHNCAGQLRLW